MATAEEIARHAGEIAERAVGGARLPGELPAMSGKAATAGRAVLDGIRHPDGLGDHAQKLQMAVPMLRQAVSPLLTGRVDWKAEYAYTAGVQAFIYGFPYIYNAKIRHDWVTQSRDPAVIPYAAVNHFWHASRLMDATYRDGGCPNNDTLYSLAWLDLNEEPVILSHPDMGDRYFTFELMASTSDNVDYIGQRTTGTDAGDFAISGPGRKGRLPAGVKKGQIAPVLPIGSWRAATGLGRPGPVGVSAPGRGFQESPQFPLASLWKQGYVACRSRQRPDLRFAVPRGP